MEGQNFVSGAYALEKEHDGCAGKKAQSKFYKDSLVDMPADPEPQGLANEATYGANCGYLKKIGVIHSRKPLR